MYCDVFCVGFVVSLRVVWKVVGYVGFYSEIKFWLYIINVIVGNIKMYMSSEGIIDFR